MANLPWRLVVLVLGTLAMVTAGCVALLVSGHASSAVDLPVIIGAFIPLVLAQLHTTSRVNDTGAKIDGLLNGEGEAVVRRALDNATVEIVTSSTPPRGTPVVSSPAPVIDQVVAMQTAAEHQAQKSRP